jgi:hypothetical protein
VESVVGIHPDTGNNAMDVRMKIEYLIPRVQHRDASDIHSEIIFTFGDNGQRFMHGIEQRRIDDPFIVQGEGLERVRYREHCVEIGHRKDPLQLIVHPCKPGEVLALGAVSISARVGHYGSLEQA